MSRQRQNTIYGLARRISYRQVRRWQMYCFDCTDSNTIYIYTSKSYPCKALAVLGLSAKCRQCRQKPYFAKKKNTVKPLILQCFLNGDGGIRTHDLYTASTMLGILCSITWCYLLLLYIFEFSKLLIFVIIAHNMSAKSRKSNTCRHCVGSHQCHFDSLITTSAVL